MSAEPRQVPSLESTPSLLSLAGSLARTAMENVVREFPYAAAHVVSGPDDLVPHRVLHPVFYGAFDWLSAVHMHWLLVRLLRLYPGRFDASAARDLLDGQLTAEGLTVEAAYLRAHPSFERPYGWAWLLALAAECASFEDDRDAAAWSSALRPALTAVADLLLVWLPRAGRPVREGGHANTAFALGLVLDAAGPLGLTQVEEAAREYAGRAYLPDRVAPAAWEPSGQDFLSPALSEADLVRRLLPAPAYGRWLTAFLPGLAEGRPPSLLDPVGVPDRSDGLVGHLDGLNLSRAAALRSIAHALLEDDARRTVLADAAARHLDAGLLALSEPGYSSSHWLGTFAALALSTD